MTDKTAVKRFAIVVGAMTAASMALYLHNQDDEEFKKLEDWQRDMYWQIRIGDAKSFIPKPFAVGAIATVAEYDLEQMIDDKVEGKVFAERMAHVLMDTFAFNPTPQMIEPMIDLYANKNSFTGRDIETIAMADLSKVNRELTGTTDLAKGASQMLDNSLGHISQNLVVSPVHADQRLPNKIQYGQCPARHIIWPKMQSNELAIYGQY